MRRPTNELLTGAVVEIKDETGKRRLGTGTVISDDGSVLTCHHVIGALEKVTLVHHASGREEVVPVLPLDLSADFDLAILRTPWTDVPPLSLAFLAETGEWNASGYQDRNLGYYDVVPLSGRYVRAGTRAYDIGRSYRIVETFDLWGDAIHGGTSGAALLDRASGCIIGVISASLTEDLTLTQVRATAVALRAPAAAWPPLEELSRRIEKTVPRFGPHLNSLGTLLLSGAQRHAAIEDLVAADMIDRQRLVARAGLASALAGFLASDRVVMPIVGLSGTGKTSIAAMLADGMDQPHALLLRGAHMQAADADISFQIERALLDTDQGTYGLDEILRPDLPRPSAETLAARAADAGKPLLVVLDAINERDDAVLPARKLAEQWFPRTIRWLRDNKTRLVVTCRSETWRLMLPANIDRNIFPPRRDDPHWRPPAGLSHAPEGGLWIDDLTDAEVNDMTAAYSLQDIAIDTQIMRHPFVMRLAAEAIARREASAEKPKISETDLLERSVAARIVNVARRTAASAAGEAQVKALVRTIATTMLSHCTDRLSGSVAAVLPLATPALLQALTDEGVLESVGPDYRFRFDQYADMERSHALVLPLTTNLGAVASQLAEPGMWSTINLAADRMMEGEAARWHGLEFMAAHTLRDFIVESDGPVELRLGLLLEVTRRGRKGYGVRIKDWHDPNYSGHDLKGWLHNSSIDKQLRILHAENGGAVLRTLVLRLADDRPFLVEGSSEGSVSSLCGGCICALNDPRLEAHYAELFNHRASWLARSVLEVSLRQRPAQIIGWMLRELAASDASSALTPDGKMTAIRLLHGAARDMSDSDRQQAAIALKPRLSDADHSVRATAASAILAFDPSSATALDLLLDALQPERTDKEFDVALDQLQTIPPDRIEKVLGLILGRLDRPASKWQVSDYGFGRHAVQRLSSAEFDSFAANVADFLLQHAGEDKEADRDIVQWGTYVIRRLDPAGEAYARTIALIDHMAGSGNDRVYLPLVDAAYGLWREEWPDGCRAIQRVIEKHGIDDNAAFWVIVHCTQNKEPASERVAMAAIHRRRDPDAWDHHVVGELLTSLTDERWAFAAAVVDYWRSLPPTELTIRSREILALLDRGEPLRRVFRLQVGWPSDDSDY
ncbi:trypsin-like peptidase domain-containing protein [Rhizobium leguminosarum]|uniref:trypsin-like peptidase domain-containing protein n=1 Tax=Rhizobium leguminosarum TaxID=384 RepID=UPI003F947016